MAENIGGDAARIVDYGSRPCSLQGEVTATVKLSDVRKALVDIQFGRADDTFGWMHRVV